MTSPCFDASGNEQHIFENSSKALRIRIDKCNKSISELEIYLSGLLNDRDELIYLFATGYFNLRRKHWL
jgi:hypothetical protein